ncbi:hypothetical protein [Pseudogracilibacillus sp. SO30301A]|uniref:hypothetical protein n=1 Tax=Pseudogracilibacillus sp. SO30301A TaxID=3098291 RepID=UPI00300E0C6E
MLSKLILILLLFLLIGCSQKVTEEEIIDGIGAAISGCGAGEKIEISSKSYLLLLS